MVYMYKMFVIQLHKNVLFNAVVGDLIKGHALIWNTIW